MNVLSRDLQQLEIAFKSKALWILLSYMIVALACGLIYWKSPRQYPAKASFLIFENQADSIALEEISSLIKLQKLSQKTLQQLALEILLSERTRNYVAQHMQPFFQKEIDRLIAEHQLSSDPVAIRDYIFGRLKIHRDIIFFQSFPSAATHIRYTNSSPEIAKQVIQLHMDYLQLVNEDLNLSGRKQFIIELDPPAIDPEPSPDRNALFILGFLITTLLWSTYFSAVLAFASLDESPL